MTTKKTDRYCFTKYAGHGLNDPLFSNPKLWGEHVMDSDMVQYLIFQKEICPETKREHFQGYVELHNRLTIKATTRFIAANLKLSYGTLEDNINYCSKGSKPENRENDIKKYGQESVDSYKEGPWIFGKPKTEKHVGQGRRTDLETVNNLIHEGKSEEEIAGICGPEFMKYNGGINKLIQIRNQTFNWTVKINRTPRHIKTKINILWGAKQSGKTYTAVEKMKKLGKQVFIKPDGMWDGYNNEPVVVIDEFDKIKKTTESLGEMLKLADEYPHKIKIRYSTIEFNSELIILTSNTDPKLWWNDEPLESKMAFWERVENVYYFPVSRKDVDWKEEPELDVKLGESFDGETPGEVLMSMNDYL